MSSANLAEGVLAVTKAAVEPVIDEIKRLRADVATLQAGAVSPDIERRLAAIEQALGLVGKRA